MPLRVGVVLTVRDEETVLRDNLLYHRHLGVERFYVFDDGSRDGTVASIADLPGVTVAPVVPRERFRDRAEMAFALERYGQLNSARQTLNALAALEAARAEGLDWLVHLDADELVCPDLDRCAPGSLVSLLESVPPDTATVIFPVIESVQRRLGCRRPFQEVTLFKQRAALLRRPLLDPYSGETFTVEGFYGHNKGKAAVRVGVPALPRGAHRFFRPDWSLLPTLRRGFLLHYFCFSFEEFARKFRRLRGHPDRFLSGDPVDRTKLLWIRLANDDALSREELLGYYRRFVLFDEPEIRRLSRRRRFGFLPAEPALVEVSGVRRAFREMAGGDRLDRAPDVADNPLLE